RSGTWLRGPRPGRSRRPCVTAPAGHPPSVSPHTYSTASGAGGAGAADAAADDVTAGGTRAVVCPGAGQHPPKPGPAGVTYGAAWPRMFPATRLAPLDITHAGGHISAV